jgi:hypothetical protein
VRSGARRTPRSLRAARSPARGFCSAEVEGLRETGANGVGALSVTGAESANGALGDVVTGSAPRKRDRVPGRQLELGVSKRIG